MNCLCDDNFLIEINSGCIIHVTKDDQVIQEFECVNCGNSIYLTPLELIQVPDEKLIDNEPFFQSIKIQHVFN